MPLSPLLTFAKVQIYLKILENIYQATFHSSNSSHEYVVCVTSYQCCTCFQLIQPLYTISCIVLCMCCCIFLLAAASGNYFYVCIVYIDVIYLPSSFAHRHFKTHCMKEEWKKKFQNIYKLKNILPFCQCNTSYFFKSITD